jgi:DNA-binding MarR family transcriptional regulator
MEAAGLVRRTAPGPGRTLAMQLTRRGQEAARGVLARRQVVVEQLVGLLDAGEVAALEQLAGRLLAGITTDRGSAYRLCRLCDEARCAGDAGCPVDHAAGA